MILLFIVSSFPDPSITSSVAILPFQSPYCLPVKDASLTRTYSFLPASWAGDAHEETDFLPIGDREEKEGQYLNCCTDSLEAV